MGDEGIELVEEDYARTGGAGAGEERADGAFRFADVLEYLLIFMILGM